MKAKKSRSENKEDKTFDYDNLEDIDKKFEQFSENYRNQQQKQTNVVPQMSLIKSIIKKKGPTFHQQAQTITQLSDLKNYFLNNCESKISMINKISSTRGLGDAPNQQAFIRSQTTKNSIILKNNNIPPDSSFINDNKSQINQQSFNQKNQNMNTSNLPQDVNSSSFIDFNRKSKKNLTFHLSSNNNNQNIINNISTNNNISIINNNNNASLNINSSNSILLNMNNNKNNRPKTPLNNNNISSNTNNSNNNNSINVNNNSQLNSQRNGHRKQNSITSNFYNSQQQSNNTDNQNQYQTPRRKQLSLSKRERNNNGELESGLASTEIYSPTLSATPYQSKSGQINQFQKQNNLASSNFSFALMRASGDSSPTRQPSNSNFATPSMREDLNSPFQGVIRSKVASVHSMQASHNPNNSTTPNRFIRDKKRGNTILNDDSNLTQTPSHRFIKQSNNISQIINNNSIGMNVNDYESTPMNSSQNNTVYSQLLQYKEQARKSNKICQIIGADLANFAVAALLLIQNRDKKYSENLDITQKFLSAFGINRRALDSMRKEEDKRDYVIKQILNQMREQYTQFQQKSELREKEIKKAEISYKQKMAEQIEREKSDKDQFKWLKIDTFYNELENNLKGMIVMKINNFYNQNFLLDKIISKKEGLNNNNNHIIKQDDNDGNTNNINHQQDQQILENQYDILKQLEDLNNSHNNNNNNNNNINNNNNQTEKRESNIIDDSMNQTTTRKRGQTLIEKRDSHIVDGVSNKLLFIQINQNQQIHKSPLNPNKHNPSHMIDALNSQFDNNDSSQKPLQNLYEKIKPKSLGENNANNNNNQNGNTNNNTNRSQSVQQTRRQMNPAKLRENYNQQLNHYIEHKQQEQKGEKKIKSFQIVKLQEQIDNCLKIGQTISETEQQPEFRWLKDNMTQGLSKQDYLDRQQRILYDNYYWNQETEEIFVKKRHQLLQRNISNVKSNNFSELTTYEFMRLILKNTNVQDINRENLVRRYQKGEQLSEEQMEFLAATNQLLNKCIDKEFMKEAINILVKNDIIQTFELILAENILKSYNVVKNILYNHRETFLSHKNEYTIQKYDEKRKQDLEYKEFLNNLDIHKKKSKMYQTVLNYLQKKKVKSTSQPRIHDSFGSQQGQLNSFKQTTHAVRGGSGVTATAADGSNLFSLEFANTTQESIPIQVQKKNQDKLAYQLTYPNQINKQIKYFNYHPPTKVVLVKDESPKQKKNEMMSTEEYNILEQIENEEKQKKEQQNKEKNKRNEDKSKIKKMKLDELQDKRKFAKFYSGGPCQKQNKEVNEKDHLKQILKIQSFCRMKIAQNLYEQLQYIKKRNNKILINHDKNHLNRFQSVSNIQTNNNFTLKNNNSIINNLHFTQSQIQSQRSLTPNIENKRNPLIRSNSKKEITPASKMYKDLKNNISQLQYAYQRDLKKKKQIRGRADRLIEYVKENNMDKIKISGLNYDEGEVLMADKFNNTALFYAVKNRNLLIAKYLLEKGANVNQNCERQNTPLHIAFKMNDQNMIFTLLEYNADLNVLNSKGYTPLGYATLETLQKYDLSNALALQKQLNPTIQQEQEQQQQLQQPIQQQQQQQQQPIQQRQTIQILQDEQNTTINNNKLIQRESQVFERSLIIESGLQTNFHRDEYRNSLQESIIPQSRQSINQFQ